MPPGLRSGGSDAFPQQAVVLEPRGDQPLVTEVAEIGAHRAAHEDILVEIHREPIGGEHLPDDLVGRAGLGADGEHPSGDLLDLGAVDCGERADILRRGGVRGDEELCLERLHPVERLEVGAHVVDETDVVFFEDRLPGEAVGEETDAVGNEFVKMISLIFLNLTNRLKRNLPEPRVCIYP